VNRSNALCQIEAGELKGKVPELKQGARTGAGRQNWSRVDIANQQRNRDELYSGE